MAPEKSDFCVEIEDVGADAECDLLNSAAIKVQDQNSRLMEVYKKTQQNCKRIVVSSLTCFINFLLLLLLLL